MGALFRPPVNVVSDPMIKAFQTSVRPPPPPSVLLLQTGGTAGRGGTASAYMLQYVRDEMPPAEPSSVPETPIDTASVTIDLLFVYFAMFRCVLRALVRETEVAEGSNTSTAARVLNILQCASSPNQTSVVIFWRFA